ncbi:hypothetical protein G9272_27415 [Streptomyces asoensis]|uniref:Uncharacterized protein n=1 Tax=Streptomyces asoensis TaxID=249586 RepID=A0A6M4WV70_9ACTN|nr:hypothetical protein [Streptomyces asoensis]QJT03551.1 hypothetical protein G9272_27415 [Streptomyces asoensis]
MERLERCRVRPGTDRAGTLHGGVPPARKTYLGAEVMLFFTITEVA